MDNSDIRNLCEKLWGQGHRVESAEAFLPLVERCIREPGLHMIDCSIDYSEMIEFLLLRLGSEAWFCYQANLLTRQHDLPSFSSSRSGD